MDRKWMKESRLSKEYADGVKEFVQFAVQHAKDSDRIICPCLKCCYSRRITEAELVDHLFCYGIDQSYTCWVRHGETRGSSSTNVGRSESYAPRSPSDTSADLNVDLLEEMVDMVEEDLRDCPKMFERLKIDAEMPLYDGCTKFTKLSAVLKLFNLKAANGWTDKSFTDLLQLLHEMLPENNVLPSRTYDAKRMLCSIGMGYERIHACPNDCVLFQNEYASLDNCPKCKASRYKKNVHAAKKVVWYFPIKPRFRRMFSNADDAKYLTWHADERIQDGKLRHPADAPQWSKIDYDYPDFGHEPRNLRLALATDGMNPHSIQSSSHSTWPVILVIYNLPPWLCMKRKYMMLSMLISGPKQPGNDIDVYLAPLIEDLKDMWGTGIEVYDGYRKETFRLRALLFGTINDFPAYGNLSGYSIKGQCACPICEESTHVTHLDNCKKNVFLGHRRFLPLNHVYRSWEKAFNGKTEEGRAPMPLTGEQLFDKIKDVSITFGKPFAKELVTKGWKKRSIFFDLPYWKDLYVRHFIDVMHVEKNVCDSVISTLLNVSGKSKDHINARLDLIKLGIRTELGPIKKGNRTYLPPAAYTLSRNEKHAFCQFIHGVKVPEGYCSNLRNIVSMNDLKLKGLKSHDCHILMEHLLPVAIRSILPKNVRVAISKLCFFFKGICSKVIDPMKLPRLERQIILTLCELEMYFPPSFFDIMVHLTVHLVRETKLCGPAYLRWMYPIERCMKILKGYVKSRSRPEGCIVERYIIEEAVQFCTDYLSNVEIIGLPKSRHYGRVGGQGISRNHVVQLPMAEREQAHLYVLHNDSEVDEYVELHKELLTVSNPNKSQNWILKEHNKTFITWLKEHIFSKLSDDPSSVSEHLKWLANGPSVNALAYTIYLINGQTFCTKDHDEKSVSQNSGVTLIAESMHVSSAKDRNPIYANMSYFGVIERIWELDYTMFRVPVFGCKWVDNNSGVKIDELGFVLVDLDRVGYKDDSFILASQAQQVFYVKDPADVKWSIVLLSNKLNANIDISGDEINERDELEDDPFFGTTQSVDIDPSRDEILYVRHDHQDGLWVNIPVYDNKKKASVNSTRKRKRKNIT